MKTEMLPLGDGSTVEVRHDLGPGQVMVAGWVPEKGPEKARAKLIEIALAMKAVMVDAGWTVRTSADPQVWQPSNGAARQSHRWVVFGRSATRRPYRVKRGRGGRRKRRAR